MALTTAIDIFKLLLAFDAECGVGTVDAPWYNLAAIDALFHVDEVLLASAGIVVISEGL